MKEQTSELIARLRSLMQKGGPTADGYLTTYEVAKELGIAYSSADRLLYVAFREGLVDSQPVSRPARDGRLRPAPGYRLKPAGRAGHGGAAARRVRRVSGRARASR